jgi:hypothetical protein
MSFALLCFAFAVTFVAIFERKTTVWEQVPPWASVVIFFVLMGCIGILEGSQIAYFAVVKMQKSEQGQDGSMGWFAKKSACILFKNHNHNLAAFLVGRQLCVVSCMFFIARITAVKLEIGFKVYSTPAFSVHSSLPLSHLSLGVFWLLHSPSHSSRIL